MFTLIQKLLRPFYHYQISPTTISVRQDGKWVDLATSEISAVKEVSVSRIIVRLYGGQRYILNLSRFLYAFETITRALQDAVHQNRATQAVWRRAKAYRARFIQPWHSLADEPPSHARGLVAELQRELAPTHPLFNQPVAAIARRYDCDDVLFYGESPERYAVVHLTWTSKQERWPSWPETDLYDSFDAFAEQRMKTDAAEYKDLVSTK